MNFLKKFGAILCATVLLLSTVSCGELRETYEVDDAGGHTVTYRDGEEPTMSVAEKSDMTVSESGEDLLSNLSLDEEAEAPDTLETVENTPKVTTSATFVITGDLLMSDDIVEFGRKAAEEVDGKDYTFIRIYTGIYRTVADADIAVGQFSSEKNTDEAIPVEAVQALSKLGYDVLDTSDYLPTLPEIEDSEMKAVSDGAEDGNALVTVEKAGLTFGFLSVGGDGALQTPDSDEFLSNLEYADLVSDILTVFVHWDDGMTDEAKKAVASSIAEGGAEIVVGDGAELGGVEWLENEDGTKALYASSLGSTLSSANEGVFLLGGVLSMTVEAADGLLEISGATVIPTLTHYTEDKASFEVYKLDEYTDELASLHGAEVSVAEMKDLFKTKVSAEFLPTSFN